MIIDFILILGQEIRRPGGQKRHPELVLCKADSLESTRAEALNEDIVNEYFDLLHKCLESNYLLRHPWQIYVCDETFLPLDYTTERG